MTLFLVDTNVLAEPLKPAPNARVLQKLNAHQDELCVGTPTIQEITFGARRLPDSRRRTNYETFLSTYVLTLRVYGYDAAVAQRHGEVRATLEKAGVQLSFADGALAAIALVHDLTLVTRNVKHFEHIAGLRIENWFL